MAFEFTISQSVLNEARSVSASNLLTGAAKTSVSEVLAADAADTQVDFAINVGDVKAFYMVSNKDALIETNSSSVPDDQIELKAGVPYVWTEDSYDSFYFTTNIDGLYVTSRETTDGVSFTLQIEALYDPTP